MMSLDFKFIQGHRAGSTLLYVPSERNLYFQKSRAANVRSFICYQEMLKQRKNAKEKVTPCKARVTLNEENICVRNNIDHSCHTDHESIKKDLHTRNAMKDAARMLKSLTFESARKISAREIFNNELKK